MTVVYMKVDQAIIAGTWPQTFTYEFTSQICVRTSHLPDTASVHII